MPPRLTVAALLLLLTLTLGAAEPAPARTATAPMTTLLAPANGSTVTINPGAYVTYKWLITWADAPPQGIIINWQLSTDPNFGHGQIISTESQTCPPQNYACWTSWAPPRAYGPPYGTYGKSLYWRVTVNGTVSATASFKVLLARDVVKPRVRAFRGSAQRGTTAHFMAQVADDRGPVRYRAALEYRGRPVMFRSFPFLHSVWTAPLDFLSARPLPRRMRPGRYQFCVTAWDPTGNRARSCAVYRVR